MNARTRILGATAALVMSVGSALAVAPAANAGVGGELVNNSNGTVTATFDVGGFDQGIYFCDPAALADLTECNRDTHLFGIDRLRGNMPPSPAILHEGMPVIQHALGTPVVGLPAGTYTIVMGVMPSADSDVIFLAGLQNASIASPAGPVIPPWVQAIGRLSADSCPTGWGASWQQWAVPITGGYVCSREIPSLG